MDDLTGTYPWNSVLHHGTDEFSIVDYGFDCQGEKFRVLLLGDSWMEKGRLSATIGHEFAKRSKRCVQVFNGSTTSYSPTLYLLKARQAFNRFGAFDSIIVNIDETDIGDEWLRYRIPTVRNRKGEITSVPFDDDLHSRFLWHGELWARNSHFYLVRLVRYSLLHNVMIPLFYEFTFRPDYASLMRYVFKPDAKTLYQKEHEYFRARLREMIDQIRTFTDDPKAVYLTHHPHLRGVLKNTDQGPSYLPVVSEALARIGEESGVTVLDAAGHLARIHGTDFPESSFISDDPYSHLTEEGAERYGRWLAEKIDLKDSATYSGHSKH